MPRNAVLQCIKKFRVLLFLIAGVLMIMFFWGDRQHSKPAANGLKKQPYACGKFGDKMLRIERNYLFLKRLDYRDVNYWDKEGYKQHFTKGCADQIAGATFLVSWPKMAPSSGFGINSKHLNDITIAVSQRTIWPGEAGKMDFFDQRVILKNKVNSFKTREIHQKKMGDAEINAQKRFNTELGLYQIDLPSRFETTKIKVFWQEVANKGVHSVTECLYWTGGRSRCVMDMHLPEYGENTSYILINFRAELLPHWQQLQHDTLKFIEFYTIKAKDNG